MRIAALLVGLMVVSTLIWAVLGARSASSVAPLFYGESFVARGFDKRTIGATLSLPALEQGAQRVPAIAVVENLSIAAREHPMARLELRNRESKHRVALVWRNSVSPTITQRLEIDGRSQTLERIDLASHRGWTGTITGLGVMAGHPGGAPLVLQSLSLPHDTASERLARVLNGKQTAVSRPIPGQESLARARHVWPLAWICAVGTSIAFLLAWWPGRWLSARAAAVSALGAITALQLGLQSLLPFVAVGAPGRGDITRTETLVGISRALADAPPDQMVHVFSGDGRGHELALALAPRRTRVTVGEQPLPAGSSIKANDWVITLGRRRIAFAPQSSSLVWTDSSGTAARVPADVMFAAGGDAVFKVRP
jgi:hypothetical protein